ncbi:diacylglycerol/lipid kinase family protein [Paenibacillus mesophilus]|uniref:diacylglycerol/lipid kinase family protein n=1 Tax=Paenibacillus mesophilus TaxID=2582849 RepID=UPI0013054768|nr:diacylglycerol kinase family protein [Paenibacillus mesophilus]
MIWFVINRGSGNGRGQAIWRQVEQSLRDRGVVYGCKYTERQGHARELALELAGQPDTAAVVAVGGDGTVHEVAGGLAGTSVPLGCIPAGSGNDYARSVSIPQGWEAALERVLELKSSPIDAGLLGGKVFAISCGIGFDGEVAKMTNRSWYKRWLNRLGAGSLSYVVSVLRLLVTYRPCDVHLTVDGLERSYKKVWLIAVANMPYYGGGMKICPNARHDDGILHMCVVENIGRFDFLRFFPRVFQGTHVEHPAVHMLSGSKIRIEGSAPMTIHTDGEYGGETPTDIVVHRNRLHVL